VDRGLLFLNFKVSTMTIGRRQLVKFGLALTGVGMTSASAEEPRGVVDASPADPKAMEKWWTDLEKDEPKPSSALLEFSDRPVESIAFFKARIKPLKLEKDRLKDLLIQLGSVDAALWAPAYEELDYFDPRLATDLDTLMSEVVDAPKRQRMVCLMSGREPESLDGHEVNLRKFDTGLNFFSPDIGSWWAEADVSKINSNAWNNLKTKWTRAVRAIALLEHLGTPDAVALLKDIASGHPFAQPTRVAHESLRRIVVKPE
jgi:hypothetical protein